MAPSMSLKTFFSSIVRDEESATSFLTSIGIFSGGLDKCPKVKDGAFCGGNLKEVVRKGRPTLRCTRRGCQACHTIRKGNKFFNPCGSGRPLTVDNILELVFLWAKRINATTTKELTGRNHQTITTWFNKCRDVCEHKFKTREKMGGPGIIIQIDESLFQGKRKYHRGRLQVGDKNPTKRRREMPTLTAVVSSDSDGDGDDEDTENQPPILELEVENDISRNYGKRVQGPWVFGLICKQTKECRLFIVKKRDAATLVPIIEREVAIGSTIMSDEWRAYSSLRHRNFEHLTVNHSKFFVDPITGAETQNIESIWKALKVRCGIKTRGADHLLERKLTEEWWRSVHKNEDIFHAILNDIKDYNM